MRDGEKQQSRARARHRQRAAMANRLPRLTTITPTINIQVLFDSINFGNLEFEEFEPTTTADEVEAAFPEVGDDDGYTASEVNTVRAELAELARLIRRTKSGTFAELALLEGGNDPIKEFLYVDNVGLGGARVNPNAGEHSKLTNRDTALTRPSLRHGNRTAEVARRTSLRRRTGCGTGHQTHLENTGTKVSSLYYHWMIIRLESSRKEESCAVSRRA